MIPSIINWAIDRAGFDPIRQLTGITQSRMTNYLTGTVIPRATTIKKLEKAYSRINYTIMRSYGVPIKEARSLRSMAPSRALHAQDIIQNAVDFLHGTKNIPTDVLYSAFSKSTKNINEFATYPVLAEWTQILETEEPF